MVDWFEHEQYKQKRVLNVSPIGFKKTVIYQPLYQR